MVYSVRKNFKIFDCSLREIGYQTGWFFSEKTVQDIYKFAQEKNIDYVELGFFHNIEANPGCGCFRYCSTKNDELMTLFQNIKNGTKLSAMRDIQRPLSILLPKKDSIVDTIRFLTRSQETDFDILDRMVDEGLTLGYEVFINFTSAGHNDIEKNIRFAEFAKSKAVAGIEFADTESVMTPEYVHNTIQECHKLGVKVGCHFHDKNGTAEALADLALAEGADFMDVTHLGLGGKWRDGNLTMDYLLHKLKIDAGYEATVIRNEIIEDLITFHKCSAAE